ncbi:hypothetical protein L7F22_067117 [Adiantum nelumboides]|nr:hypothetical protein [Adiantum nelumboides]
MLLRTSSAPVLSALNSSFFQTEVCKDSVEPPHNVLSSNMSSFHSMSSPSFHLGRTSSHGICAGEDAHAGLGSEQELGRASRPSRLSRAQSEGDLACFSAAMVASTGHPEQGMPGSEIGERDRKDSRASLHSVAPPLDVRESILEEPDEAEQLSPLPMCSWSPLDSKGLRVLKDSSSFVLNDGEVYSSLKVNPSGSPIACNEKGCRPLTKLECKQLGFLDMACGIGSDNFEWGRGNNGMNFDSFNSRDAYFRSLLQSDPENPLLLQNYAQYLTKKGEVKKAEEYFERAILADPSDGDVLSKYAKLQWDVNRDHERAEAYYDQAVQAAPNDCYVMASYASFLWDVEDNEEASPAASALPAYGTPPVTPSPLLASA